MPQHFLMPAKACSLSLSAVLRMTDEEAELAFLRIRWPGTDGRPACPNCQCEIVYDCRKAASAMRGSSPRAKIGLGFRNLPWSLSSGAMA